MGIIGALFFQVLLAFLLLIGFLAFVYFFVRRKTISFGKNIRVVERFYLDRSTSIVLVRLMDDYYFILVTPSGATVLKKLTEEEMGSLEQAKESSFSEIFFKHIARKSKKGENQ
ncbi:FliO/MopB family protein [Pseudothermotoga thermarum]|uniref:Flagellar biosynthesis protein FliZ, putative n=1 Tax=Pseudothermotoga thermarum DSM 5069 TaxID=688269 RepID=F7YXY1_9THEM|nr:flagellar biosynthetic protein FliO [Pseudothermotoga thermarum]AEH50780.1 flagellar biosynthesis protein FliZ, putative [Pseudothermotoga thermarum DSM 5069]